MSRLSFIIRETYTGLNSRVSGSARLGSLLEVVVPAGEDVVADPRQIDAHRQPQVALPRRSRCARRRREPRYCEPSLRARSITLLATARPSAAPAMVSLR